MEQHLIAVVGSSPGVGKSTLCGALARWADASGAVVDHFEEADILVRPAFSAVAEEFAGGAGSVRPRTLVEATRSYVEQARADGVDVLVTDALIPFIPSLVAWGHDETAIAEVVHDLEEAVQPARVTVVFLRDDPEVALRRAVEREGPQWADWYVDKLRNSPGTASVSDLASAADHLRRESELTLRRLAATRWNVVSVDVGERDAAQTERYVRERLQELPGIGARRSPA
ncbi:ATP-binding protein [Streptomyces sp. NPDC002790]|uniref:ATP-binding protein n=1 Tax=Streptomyces sp. NPDC002790 TaxID=3154431 RepID=UPI003326D059